MTDAPDFAHLHVHSDHSFLDGKESVTALAARAAALGHRYLALTDHGNCCGLFAFDGAARAAGITPLFGCEFYLTRGRSMHEPDGDAPGERFVDDQFHLTVLAGDAAGFRNLLALTSQSWLLNFYRKPRITLAMLAEHAAGLYVLSGCVGSYINQAIIAASFPQTPGGRDGDRQRKTTGIGEGEVFAAEMVFRWFVERFPGRFAVELMNHGLAVEAHCQSFLVPWAHKYGVPLVATNDVHVCTESDLAIQDVMIKINTRGAVDDGGMGAVPGVWMKTAAEMDAIPDLVKGLDAAERRRLFTNSVAIAEQCAFPLPKPGSLLPRFPLPDGERDIGAYLRREIERGIAWKYPAAIADATHPARERARTEYAVIERMGFCDYFAVVQDLVRWAKDAGIMVGPGRGSAAGSLLAYVLDITTVDPLAYDLLFERFLNPDRVSMPDIDIDFEDTRRDEVVQYVCDRYGADHVAHIATFTQFAARSALNDVARVHGIDSGAAHAFSSLFAGDLAPLEVVECDRARVTAAIAQDRRLGTVYAQALALQGTKRQAGTHPSGILIARAPIGDHAPLMRAKDAATGLPQIQWDMHDAEDLGMLKMDFLGLRTLTLLRESERLIDERGSVHGDGGRPQDAFHIEDVPLDDPAVYAMLRGGQTFGVFQLEKGTASAVTRELAPDGFADIIAINALARPGPLDNLASYVARKRGQERVIYAHPELEPILASTYGFPLFQDQVMRIARVLAGYTLAEADSLRRAMGKKLPAEMASHEARFIGGCIAKGIDRGTAVVLFETLAKFSGYGFNLAHATCYALIGYWTAWLACHEPVRFFAALLTTEAGRYDRVGPIICEMRRRGIPILPVDVAHSAARCTIETGADGEGVRLGLTLVKGVSAATADAIREYARGPGRTPPLDALDDLLLHVPSLNLGTILALNAAGALDGIDYLPPFPTGASGRAWRADHLPGVIKRLQSYRVRAKKFAERAARGLDPSVGALPYRGVAPAGNPEVWSETALVHREREALGINLTPSPLLWLAGHLGESVDPLTDLVAGMGAEGERLTVLIEIQTHEEKQTKRGRTMGKYQVCDAVGNACEMVIFADAYAQFTTPPAVGQVLRGTVRINQWGGMLSLVADALTVLSDAMIEAIRALDTARRRKDASGLHLVVDDPAEAAGLAARFLAAHDGGGAVPLYFHPTAGGPPLVAPDGCASAEEARVTLGGLFPGPALVAAEGPLWDQKKKRFVTLVDGKRQAVDAPAQLLLF